MTETDEKYGKYMQNYREFGQQQTRPAVPEFLQSKPTNPKKIMEDQTNHKRRQNDRLRRW